VVLITLSAFKEAICCFSFWFDSFCWRHLCEFKSEPEASLHNFFNSVHQFKETFPCFLIIPFFLQLGDGIETTCLGFKGSQSYFSCGSFKVAKLFTLFQLSMTLSICRKLICPLRLGGSSQTFSEVVELIKFLNLLWYNVTNLWLIFDLKNQFTTINLLDLKKVGRKVLVTKGFCIMFDSHNFNS
jgi:hypothetical protein